MATLNSKQQIAVKTTDHPLLVLAGAGSGKTRVITEKIVWLIEQGIAARNIVALTFTNKAAREMKQRVSKRMDDNRQRGLKVSTFHALGLDILRKECQALGYKSAISLFDEQDRTTLLKELVRQDDAILDSDQVEHYGRQIGQWKNAFVTHQEAKDTAPTEQQPVAKLYQTYVRQLKAYNAVDFDDLILLPVMLLQQQPEVLEKWQLKIRHLLVDEYQDTNDTQYQFMKLLVGELGHFTVVGDDDQSIYAWRGAQPENLRQLQHDFPRLKVIKLEQNYRSTGRILKVANQLISNNSHVFEKRLWSEHGYGEVIKVLSHNDEQTEAQQIVSEIIHHKFKTGSSYQDYAILYRGNYQSRLFEKALRENNIPYFISGSTSFFAYAEVKDILAYFRLLVNPDDDAAFLRIINTPRREIGPSTLEKLGDYANKRHVSLFAACFEMGLKTQLGEAALRRLNRFCDMVVDTADRAKRGATFEVLNELIQKIGYEQWLDEISKSDTTTERKKNNVIELMDWLQRMAEPPDGPGLSLDEVIAKIMLMDILDRNQEQENNDQVSLMTLHSAKGLEFPHVFLIGMEENLLPHQNSIDSDTIEEERRLAYVGITRSQKTCTLSYCTHRKRYGEIIECQPSRFLEELPQEDLEWTNKTKLDFATQKQRGKANLASLKSLLGSGQE